MIIHQNKEYRMTLSNRTSSTGDENRYSEGSSGVDGAILQDDTTDNNLALSSAPLSFHRRCGELITLSSPTNISSNTSSQFSTDAGRR